MKGILLEDFDSDLNENSYKRGHMVDVTELESFKGSYAIYRYDGLDWLPKSIVKII